MPETAPLETGVVARGTNPLNPLLGQYSYLQVLDFLTTIAFLVNGVREGNPVVRMVLGTGINPIASLLLVKFLAMLLGLYCWRAGKRHIASSFGSSHGSPQRSFVRRAPSFAANPNVP